MTLQDVGTIIDGAFPSLLGWCSPEKGKRMAEIAEGAETCVELGVYGGRGLIAMALALRDRNTGRAYGVDPYEAQASLEGHHAPANNEFWSRIDYEDVAKQAQQSIDRLGLSPFAWLIRARSAEAVHLFRDGSIDVMHQDSNHSEEVSCGEVVLWVPKMRAGAYWIFDDTKWTDENNKVTTQKAQDMLVDCGYVELEDHGTWKVFRRS